MWCSNSQKVAFLAASRRMQCLFKIQKRLQETTIHVYIHNELCCMLYTLPSGDHAGLFATTPPTPPSKTVSIVTFNCGEIATDSMAHSATAMVLRGNKISTRMPVVMDNRYLLGAIIVEDPLVNREFPLRAIRWHTSEQGPSQTPKKGHLPEVSDSLAHVPTIHI